MKPQDACENGMPIDRSAERDLERERLTAYVLGELEPSQRGDLERELAHSTRLQAEKARLEAARQAAEGRVPVKPGTGAEARPQREPAASFSDHLHTAKAARDPLLDRIVRGGRDTPGTRR